MIKKSDLQGSDNFTTLRKRRFKNIAGKGENYQHFRLFSLMFAQHFRKMGFSNRVILLDSVLLREATPTILVLTGEPVEAEILRVVSLSTMELCEII